MIFVYTLVRSMKSISPYRIEDEYGGCFVLKDLEDVLLDNNFRPGIGASASEMPDIFKLLASYENMEELKKNIKIDIAEEFI